MRTIDAQGLDFAALNRQVRDAVAQGERRLSLSNVNGQRYIGCGIKADNLRIQVNGVAGTDLAAFMDGPEVVVHGNAESAIGNTMNSGKVVVHGDVGDVVGYSMRGGKIHVKGNAGYRVGIHMKSFRDKSPILVVGGVAQDFLAEYMAGGTLVVLGLGRKGRDLAGRYVGTGMHGGTIYLRGELEETQLGREVGSHPLSREDHTLLGKILKEYCADFDLRLGDITSVPFTKLASRSHRPYGQHYAY